MTYYIIITIIMVRTKPEGNNNRFNTDIGLANAAVVDNVLAKDTEFCNKQFDSIIDKGLDNNILSQHVYNCTECTDKTS